MENNKIFQKFIKKKNKKILFTPGPASLLKENIIGIEPCFGRGDKHYAQIEQKALLSKVKFLSL